jgi:adenosylmethionine-8-amino-7-oxononanoate aminotransferase
MGAMIASDHVAEPFMEGTAMFAHGFTFAGHPVSAAIGLANLDILEREDLCGHVLAKEAEFRSMLERLRDLPIVGDVRGAGYFMAIELVKDRDTRETFDDDESEWLLRGFLSGELFRHGLICRSDDRGDPVIQLSPPLIADTEQFNEVGEILHTVLEDAWDAFKKGAAARSGGDSRPRVPSDSQLGGIERELVDRGVPGDRKQARREP